MKRVFLIVCLALTAVILGFFQENLKVNINYILETGDKIPTFFEQSAETKKQWLNQVKIDAPFDYYHNHQRIDSLLDLSRKNLVIAKWIVTIVFVGVFMLLNAFILRQVTKNNKLVLWCFRLYIFFFALSFLIYLCGIVTGSSIQAYGVSRKIVGGLQSLVPLMILLPAHWLFGNQLMNQKAHEKSL